ncbi:GNAT family N-acetyltransferase [Erwinia mallotivora]|uniref:Acetyltransferase n=1 Tax=Erwinia mallotivora TaxID=69222 RepID=A0A014N833_9GAMM|nr:GNAT family N-acetyltransferase [Erwinia mallotivora]EXU75553.1 acetyltransferase [Erwinia mallotivora]
MKIRQATEGDAAAITEIYNEAVLQTTAVWNDCTVDITNRIKWLSDRQNAGFSVLVAVDQANSVLGYATYGAWRPWDGYRHTVEDSIYVDKNARGKGTGAALMKVLIQQATLQGKHIMVAGIESSNEASLALHRKFGFTDAGRLSEVGCKFGHWLDLNFLHLRLDSRANPD